VREGGVVEEVALDRIRPQNDLDEAMARGRGRVTGKPEVKGSAGENETAELLSADRRRNADRVGIEPISLGRDR
jgi:hypothetical protein